MEHVFVYGTLRRGEHNDRLLAASELLAERALVAGTLWDTGNGYPALTLDGAETTERGLVYGELYRVTAKTLALLDRLEDYYGEGDPRNEYDRVRVNVWADGNEEPAWVYVYTREKGAATCIRISTGDWKLHRAGSL